MRAGMVAGTVRAHAPAHTQSGRYMLRDMAVHHAEDR